MLYWSHTLRPSIVSRPLETLSTLDSKTLLGRAIRIPLRWIPKHSIVRVMSGPSAGTKWVVGSAPHGAWLGTLERSKLRHFVAHVKPGNTVWDVGANVGLYAVASARAAGSTGTVVAFEPIPRNLDFLRRHKDLNRLDNLTVVEAAVFDRSGALHMQFGDSPSEFHVSDEGAIEVDAIDLDTWSRASAGGVPDIVKIDVEGAEAAVLRGGHDVFSRHRPLVYLALHGDEPRERCQAMLQSWGYRLTPLDGADDPSASDEWFAEP